MNQEKRCRLQFKFLKISDYLFDFERCRHSPSFMGPPCGRVPCLSQIKIKIATLLLYLTSMSSYIYMYQIYKTSQQTIYICFSTISLVQLHLTFRPYLLIKNIQLNKNNLCSHQTSSSSFLYLGYQVTQKAIEFN